MKLKVFFITLLLLAAVFSNALAEPVTICILDSGSNLLGAEGWNFISDSDDLTDSLGHGTKIHALLLAGAPDARIYVLKCFESDKSFDEEAVVRALYAAVDEYGADIINMSWTNTKEREALREAIAYAYEKDAVLIASVGNLSFSSPLGSAVYPAAWDEVIGVGGVNLDEEGIPEGSLWYLTGEMVYVCALADYDGEKGTSYAAPRVAAVAAGYLEAAAENVQESVRRMLREDARDLGEPGYDTIYGWGYIENGK